MNRQLQRASGGRALPEAVTVADHDCTARDPGHFGHDRRRIRNVMQYTKRHDDIETAFAEGKSLAAGIVQNSSKIASPLTQRTNRLYALNLQAGAPLLQEPYCPAGTGPDVQNALRPDHIEQRCRVFKRYEMLPAWPDVDFIVCRGCFSVIFLLPLRH
jgi:hypothetical protein